MLPNAGDKIQIQSKADSIWVQNQPWTLNLEPWTFFMIFFFTLFSIIANTYLNFWIRYTIEIVEQLKVLLQAIDGGGNLGWALVEN